MTAHSTVFVDVDCSQPSRPLRCGSVAAVRCPVERSLSTACVWQQNRVVVDNPQVFPSMIAAQTSTRPATSSPCNVRACVKNRGRVGAALGTDLMGNAVSNSVYVI